LFTGAQNGLETQNQRFGQSSLVIALPLKKDN